MKLNLIQSFVLVAALTAPAALASGQSTDPDVAPAKPKPQASSTDSKKADSKKTDSKKTDSNGKNSSSNKISVVPGSGATKSGATKSGPTGQASPIRIVPQTEPATGKKPAATTGTPATGSKATAQPTPGKPSGSTPATAKKTTGDAAAHESKTAGSGAAATHPANGQKKQPVPVLTVKPVPKQAPVQKSATTKSTATSPTGKKAGVSSPFARKTGEPKIVQKKPATTSPVAAAKVSSKISSAGRRDPFVSPIRAATVATPTGPISCATGKRCLAVAELTVQGTAKDTDGKMMAIIARGANHPAYFLRENDQIFNGNVVKITCDSVIFREYATDASGRQNTHEVVKNVFSNSEAHKCRNSQ